MTLWKAWSDIRQKFYLCAVLVTLLVVPGTVTLAVRSVQAAARTTAGADADLALQASTELFAASLERWTQGGALLIFSLLAVVLGVGGTMTRANARSNLMTLSLPEPRHRWLVSQWVVATGLLVGLCAWEAFIFIVTGLVSGLGAPVGDLVLATLLTSLSASLWIWPSILGTAFTRDAVRAALIVVSVMVALGTMMPLVGLEEWMLRSVADLTRWRTGIPWRPLIAGAGLSAVAGWLALRKFERTEY